LPTFFFLFSLSFPRRRGSHGLFEAWALLPFFLRPRQNLSPFFSSQRGTTLLSPPLFFRARENTGMQAQTGMDAKVCFSRASDKTGEGGSCAWYKLSFFLFSQIRTATFERARVRFFPSFLPPPSFFLPGNRIG